MTVRALALTFAVVAANAAILLIAGLVGGAGRLGYGIGCFYERHPLGSACNPEQGQSAFLSGFVPTAVVLYAILGLILGLAFAARKLMKAK